MYWLQLLAFAFLFSVRIFLLPMQLRIPRRGELVLLRQIAIREDVSHDPQQEFVEEPMENLQTILDSIGGPSSGARITEAPRMADLTGFGQFLQNLKNQGMNPHVTGDFPVNHPGASTRSGGRRPYLVR